MGKVTVTSPAAQAPAPAVELSSSASPARLALSGRLDQAGATLLWERATALAAGARGPLEIDLSRVEYLDGFGAALVLDLRRRCLARGEEATMAGLRPEFKGMLEPFDPAAYATLKTGAKPEPSAVEGVGDAAKGVLTDLLGFVAFVGELAAALAGAALHPRSVRWKDVRRVALAAGAEAIPVLMLVGFLIGFVMAFQSAIPMRQFGADIFIPSLVGIAILRELGPIMTAVGLAGRSGAAFAAEIGTMKVNDEVSALVTLGLAPVRFLVVPRVLATVLVTPFLILFVNAAGLLGGLLVFVSLGYPMSLFLDQLEQFIAPKDLFSGVVKGFVFGFIVAAVGCLRGLQTTTGSSAVGRSATSGVVTSIVLVVIANGLFAVLYYALRI